MQSGCQANLVLVYGVSGYFFILRFGELCESEKAVERFTMPYAATLLTLEVGGIDFKVTIGLEGKST